MSTTLTLPIHVHAMMINMFALVQSRPIDIAHVPALGLVTVVVVVVVAVTVCLHIAPRCLDKEKLHISMERYGQHQYTLLLLLLRMLHTTWAAA